jgi:transcriptional regulator with PAS, ATPase and Fis domain
VVAAPHGEWLAGARDGWDAAGVRAWLDRPDGAVTSRGVQVEARAQVRYGGARIAAVVAVADATRARSLAAAVEAAAAVAGPLVRARLDSLAAAARGDALAREILGVSPAIVAVRAAVARAAVAPFSVVIEGESGTGKELVARALHRLSPRRDRPFAALN